MSKFLLLMTISVVACAQKNSPATDQIVIFKNNTKGPVGIMATAEGAPIESVDAGSTLNTNLIRNEFFLESLSHFVRERIPVRPVHPKGAGAFGYFITTHDVSHLCKAEFLSKVGKVTPIASRLSMGATERGGSDLFREPRGFSVKFYTREGNFDIAGFNTPVFTVKDPTLFVPFGHVMRKNPAFDLPDLNMAWDYLVQHPEGLFIFMFVFSDEGVPDGYRHMPGYSIHTYPLYNEAGKITFARWHFRPVSGIKYLNSTEAARLGANDPDYAARDLYDSIATGDYPTWEVSLQLMSPDDVKKAKFDPFDITKMIPESQYPLHPIGKMVLNRNPKNYFAEVEQLAFCPANLVPGIIGAPDKTFEARTFSYKDSHRYRLGSNGDKIPVNCPYRSSYQMTYNRDGVSPVNNNGLDIPNYYPNGFNGPVPYVDKKRPAVPKIIEAEANNFDQINDYYTNMNSAQQSRLIENMVANLCRAAKSIQEKIVKIFGKINSDLSKRINNGLKTNKC